MNDCDCLPCQWRRERPREAARQACIYSGTHGLRRAGDPAPESVRVRTRAAQAIYGL